jgi:hypothetical protein
VAQLKEQRATAAEEEREACAKVVDADLEHIYIPRLRELVKGLADRIRARGGA